MGDQRLRARLRRLPPAGRPARGHHRPQARLHGRARDLLGRLASVRPRVERRGAHRRARAPGPRRRRDHAVRALDPDHDVRRGTRAQHRPRRLGRRRRLRRRRGRSPGRHPHRPPLLGVDLLRERSGRHCGPAARTALARREPGRTRPEPRRARGRAHHLGPRPARPRDHPGQVLGVDVCPDDRRVRRLGDPAGSVPALGATPAGTARSALDLRPPPDAHGRERDRCSSWAPRCSRCS